MMAGERPVQVPACNSEARKLRTKTSTPEPARHDLGDSDQPPGITSEGPGLPPAGEAAERVVEFIMFFGDGRVDEFEGPPLFARDLEALTRLAESHTAAAAIARREVVERVEALADEWDATAKRCGESQGLLCCSSCVGRQAAAVTLRAALDDVRSGS